MNEIIKMSLEQPTLEEALAYAALCETDRVFRQAKFARAQDGYETNHLYLIRQIIANYGKKD